MLCVLFTKKRTYCRTCLCKLTTKNFVKSIDFVRR
nr:MAG TPA_asm: hypothetical protein [Caudoviricetes sp.]